MKRFLMVGLLTAALLAGCQQRKAAETDAPAPELAVLDLDGRAVKLADRRGSVVLINFWMTGCGPCLAEMPALDSVHQAYKDRGFALLAVNMGQDQDTIVNAGRRLAVSFPLLSDRLMITTKAYQVVGVPVSVLIDRDGVLRHRFTGPVDRDELARRVAALL
ncbi:redoxin family protein [Azospirillum doebereinerae]